MQEGKSNNSCLNRDRALFLFQVKDVWKLESPKCHGASFLWVHRDRGSYLSALSHLQGHVMVQGWCWHCSWQGQISGWKEQGRQERNFGGIPSRAGSLCMTQSTYFRTHLLGQNRSSWQHLSKGEIEKCSLFLFPKKATCPVQN